MQTQITQDNSVKRSLYLASYETVAIHSLENSSDDIDMAVSIIRQCDSSMRYEIDALWVSQNEQTKKLLVSLSHSDYYAETITCRLAEIIKKTRSNIAEILVELDGELIDSVYMGN